jgi:phage gpG-like protein
MATVPRGRGTPRPRTRDLNASVGGLVFARNLTGVDFEFQPSIGLIASRIDKLGMDIRSFKEPLTRAVVGVMIPSFKANFESEGRPGWEPLAPYTVERRKGREHPILFRSGKLKKVASSRAIWQISQNGAVITSLPAAVWYGTVHQAGLGGFGKHLDAARKKLGSGAKARNVVSEAFDAMDASGGDKRGAAAIPARPFIMFQEEDEYAIQEVFFDWLEERADRWWGRG